MSEGATQSMDGGTEPTGSLAPKAGAPRSSIAHALPARIGRYAIVRVLGEGGMGTVYEAEQESPKRAVALKVIRAGYLSPQLLKRFEHESAVLGRLQHPGIAQVYEAGTVQDEHGHPVPFFAMEFIRGVPLTEYSASKRLGTRERLDLVARICDAVYHAHQKGVIHRDLKPGNILVDGLGQPKILDFGVARATDSDVQQTTLQTDIGQLIGTVPYMSPEQVGGEPDELDTRSDVYALGVIAYELLAGRLPYDLTRKMIAEAARIIKEEEPTRLSSINRTFRGDVETIVAKALEKDKVRRYQSAESLASDIRRYLKHEPIAARPASTWYQASKFAGRNKGLVGGVAAAFVLLIAGVIGTGIGLEQAVKARDAEALARREADIQRDSALAARAEELRQRTVAEAQRDKAQKIADFMSETLEGAGPSVALGRDRTMLKEMMDVAATRIEKGDLRDAPEAELRLRGTIGDTYRELAAFDEAAKMLDPMPELALSNEGGEGKEFARSLSKRAGLLRDRGDLAGAEELLRHALEIRRRLYPAGHRAVAQTLNDLGYIVKARGDLAGAEPLLRESLALYKGQTPVDELAVAATLSNLGILMHERGELAAAEEMLFESLEIQQRLQVKDHPSTALGLRNLASVLEERGDLARAEPMLRQSVEIERRLFGPDHPRVAQAINMLARLLMEQGKLDEAEARFTEALDIKRRAFGGDHSEVELALGNLALVLRSRGKVEQAEPLAVEALDMARRLFPGDHPDVASALNNLAVVRYARGDLAGSASLLRESVEMERRLIPGDRPAIANRLSNLASVLHVSGDLAGAEPVYRDALAMLRRLYPGDHQSVALALSNLGGLLRARGDLAGAQSLLRESVQMYEHAIEGDHWYKAAAHLEFARVLLGLKRFAEAQEEFNVAGRIASNAQGMPATWHAKFAKSMIELYETWDAAEPGAGHNTNAADWKVRLDALARPDAGSPQAR